MQQAPPSDPAAPAEQGGPLTAEAAAALDPNNHIDIEELIRAGLLNRDEAAALAHSQQSDAGGAARLEALPSSGEADLKDDVKEAAVKHKRHWVRVTRLCNQRCTFCLDSMNQDGTYIEVDSLKAYIALGRRMGRERLILSGGEASVHPEYIELIRYGRELGYDWIQTITNGMMFSYKKFARAAVAAGLNEATVSLHGHTAWLQDKLTGTPGAFVTGIKGLKNLQDAGAVVNIDVVINKQNYKFLPDILDYYYKLGIREFDLLHIIPFGRGFDEHRHSLFFDLNDAVPYFRKAFRYADMPGVYLWTNRLPVPYLEDFERLIQDPHKLFYEFDGGRHNFEGFLKRGLKPDCWGERCDYCFLDGPCRQTMFPYRAHLVDRSFPVVRLDSHHVWSGPEAKRVFEAQAAKRVWLQARDAIDAGRAIEALGFSDARVTVELDKDADATGVAALPRVDRVVVRGVEAASRYLVGRHAVAAPTVVELELDADTARWLLRRPATAKTFGDRLVCRLPNHAFLSESKDLDPDPVALAKLARLGVRLKNVPRCLAGDGEAPRATVEAHDHALLDANLLDRGGDLDLDRYVDHYIEHEYYAKSLRCRRCAFEDGCSGLHISYLRNFGFRVLTPLDAQAQPVADAGSFEQITEVLRQATADHDSRDRKKLVGMHQPAKTVTVALENTRLGRTDPA